MQVKLWNPLRLKELMGLDGMVKDSVFLKLGEYLKLVAKQSNRVIRHAGEIETEAHVLKDGLVGMFLHNELIRLFFPGEIFIDYQSYREQTPSKYEYRTLLKSRYLTLPFENEQRILRELPELREVSGFLIARVKVADEEWAAFSQLPYEDRLRKFEERVPNLRYVLKIKDLGSLLDISKRSVSRLRVREDSSKDRFQWKEMVSQIIKYPFQAKAHPQMAEIESLTTSWASQFHSLLNSQEEVRQFQKSKLVYLSSYLYPELEFQRAVWVSKLFVWLFILDDLTDQLPLGQKAQLWTVLDKWVRYYWGEEEKSVFLTSRIALIVNAFEDIWLELKVLDGVSPEQLRLIQTEVRDFIRNNREEAELRDSKSLPGIEQYLKSKPYHSGAQLAVNLGCLEFLGKPQVECKIWSATSRHRALAAELIYLDNDLISFLKEQRQNDPMNLLSLFLIHKSLSLEEAKAKLIKHREQVLNEFFQLNKQRMEDQNLDDHLLLQHLKNVEYKISGSAFWSLSITNRYEVPFI